MPSADRPPSSVSSYSYINDTLSTKSKAYANKYKQFVIDYAIEWEKVVRTRVDTGMKTAEDLRRELDHYSKKVEELRNTTNRTMNKGKQIKQETQEKLKRNEEKLVSAKESYNKVAHELCILIEEVTDRAWRDLHPLLVKIAQFDMTLAQDESQALSSLEQVVSKLKEVSKSQGISPQPRLKDIASAKPEVLSTRPGGVSAAPALSIESSLSLNSATGMSGSPGGGFDDMARPPGSVAPQGIGGFPVQVSDSNPRSSPVYQRQDSMHSQVSEPLTTLGMLSIGNNAAPAPTLDDVYSSQHSDSASVHSTGALSTPVETFPRRSSSMVSQYSHSHSLVGGNDDAGSVYSTHSFSNSVIENGGGSGVFPPPPSMPPPPPSMPPPPPPSAGFGGGAQTAYPPAPSYTVAEPPMVGGFDSGHNNPFGPPPSLQHPPTPSAYGPPPVSTGNPHNPTNPFG